MDNKEIYAAITALLTVGVLLLNLGANTVGVSLVNGLALIGVGAALIVGAVLLFKLLAGNVAAEAVKLGADSKR